MAHDKTPERNNLIFYYTVLSVITLLILDFFFFNDYFTLQSESEVGRQVLRAPAADLAAIREQHQRELESGPMPIERAMSELARRGRLGFDVVRPEASDERAPLEGWTFARVSPVSPGALPVVAPAPDPADEAELEEGEAPAPSEEEIESEQHGSARRPAGAVSGLPTPAAGAPRAEASPEGDSAN